MEKIVVAIIAALVSLIVGVVSSWVTYRLSVEKHAREYMLEYQVENLVLKFLSHENWRMRTFKTIKYHIAGFEDNELRKILLRVGAVRFEDQAGIEVWGLYDRVKDLLDNEYGTKEN